MDHIPDHQQYIDLPQENTQQENTQQYYVNKNNEPITTYDKILR